jgi:hypothetical protein
VRLLWDLYWPAIVAGLVIGVIAGAIAYRPGTQRTRTITAIAIGIAATLAASALWHGPLGTADRFRGDVERNVRSTLDYYEMAQVQGRLEADPLGRTLSLSGTANDFQRSELIRILRQVPGVATVQWRDTGQGSSYNLPLIAEMELWSLVAFGLGLLLSYLVELRRRARAEWRW